MIDLETLRFRQSLPLAVKIKYSERRIREWYDYHEGKVSVSFSGGKDSTVLLHLVRSIYPDVPAVFVDTGLEFPEIRSFVKQFDNVVWLKPKMSFKDVLQKKGYPVVSKNQAQYIREVQNTKSDNIRRLRLEGIRKDGTFTAMSMISKKWQYLTKAPFKVSDKCCEVMKKKPFDEYFNRTGNYPYVGTMAGEGKNREKTYLSRGCNVFDTKRPQSKPISCWMEADVWQYLKGNKLSYSEIYDKGYDRTGCVFCAFGAHLDKPINRFQRLKLTHPKMWNYCMSPNGLDMQRILMYCGIETGFNQFGIQKDMFDPDPLTVIDRQTDITEFCEGMRVRGAL